MTWDPAVRPYSQDLACESPSLAASMGVVQGTTGVRELSPDQADKVEALAEAIRPVVEQAAPFHDIFATRECCERYLRAKGWDLRAAQKQLLSTLEWRRSYRPQDLAWKDLQRYSDGKLEQLADPDKQGRPVLMMRTHLKSSAPSDKQVALLVYHLEMASHAADKAGVEKMTWLIDLGGFSIRNSPPWDVIKQTMHILQAHYPERLALGVLVRPSLFFRGLWGMIHALLDPNTRKKVCFIHNKKDADTTAELGQLFNLDSVEASLGGRRADGFEAASYAQRMAAAEASYKGSLRENEASSIKALSLEESNGHYDFSATATAACC